MKIGYSFLLIALLGACGKDDNNRDLKGTYVDALTKRDTILIIDNIVQNEFSYKSYRWQDSSLTSTYYFNCRTYLKEDTMAILSLLSSSSIYRMVYFKPQNDYQSFIIDSFYDFRNPLRKEIFVRIK